MKTAMTMALLWMSVTLGCSRGETRLDGGTRQPPLDGFVQNDAGQLEQTACAQSNCPATTFECCTAHAGSDGRCLVFGDPNCADAAYGCDGPEDCSDGVCCVRNAAGGVVSQCARSAGSCSPGQVMCHVDRDCPTATPRCCPELGGPYGVCEVTC